MYPLRVTAKFTQIASCSPSTWCYAGPSKGRVKICRMEEKENKLILSISQHNAQDKPVNEIPHSQTLSEGYCLEFVSRLTNLRARGAL